MTGLGDFAVVFLLGFIAGEAYVWLVAWRTRR